MRSLLCCAALSLASCTPVAPPPSSRPLPSTAGPLTKTVAPIVAPPVTVSDEPEPQAVKSLDWPLVPTTRVALHQNIWFETERKPAEAAALTIGAALNALGGAGNPAGLVPAALPKQPVVAWQRRDAQKLRVVLDMEVVLTRGYLEHFLSRSESGKDHESILQADVNARAIHEALLRAGARPGSPVRYEPDFRPPRGTVVSCAIRP